MNKKLFATLLLIPMLIFVADQVMGNVGPEGGKDKKKKKHDTEAQAAKSVEQTEEVQQEESIASENMLLSTDIGNTNAEKIALLKGYFVKLVEDSENGIWHENRLRSYSETIPNETKEFLEEELISKIEEIDPLELGNPEEWFSRCASGYKYSLDGTFSQTPLDTGVLCYRRGCAEIVLGKFKYDVEAATVVMLLPGDMEPVSIAEYAVLYEIIMG